MTGWIAFGILIFLLAYGVLLYNGLVNLKHGVARAWANIDVVLRQRHDELPKLVEVCRQYQQFEQATLERVISARAGVASAREQRDIPALGSAENSLRTSLGQLFAVAEAYPELRASEHFRQLQGRISGLENSIADRRELYNEAVNLNNVRVEQLPDLLIARLCGFGLQPLLEFAAAEKADVNIAQLFKG
ncbi:LemA family protein [Uliginosibacterium aquaticum]|uniref:LemA family protein n=1 Tax=Uliginosibacterium aquaticum TaxID=2731212 RepID=A0ABX2IJL7_9RHOO|nr:LemA family protein [Uliginosibacterium aquaticum]NSL54518.1 LemA family protein [Uliginosibacterium aquaticum]